MSNENETHETFGPYDLIRELGRGGQGVVWLAEERKLGRRVALKVLRSGPGSVGDRELARFRREAESASKLDHPNICTLFDAGEVDGAPFLSFRFVEGETLAERVDRAATPARGDCDGRASETETGADTDPSSKDGIQRILTIFEKTARALHAAHEKGLIHRDMKPANVMLTTDGEPVVLDFGLAREEVMSDASLTHSGDLLGTPAYMSPEQLMAHRVPLDRRTDIYSLGATLYECLTLARPFTALTRAELYQEILHSDPVSVGVLNKQVPRDLQVVLETAMEKDRNRRYQSALDFAEDLRRLRQFEPIRAKPMGPSLRARRWAQRHPVATAVTGLLVVGLAVLSGLLVLVIAQRDQARISAMIAESADLLRTDPLSALRLALDAEELGPDDEQRPHVLSRVHAAFSATRERRGFPLPDVPTIQALCFDPDDPRGQSIMLLGWDPVTRTESLFRTKLEEASASWKKLSAADVDRFFPVRLLSSFGAGARVRCVLNGIDLRAEGNKVLVSARGATEILPHNGAVRSIHVAADGRIVTCAADGAIRMWGPDLELRDTFLADTDRSCWRGRPQRALFSPDGSQILSTDMDRNFAVLWSPAAPSVPLVKIQHGSAITSLAFYPAQGPPRWILTSSFDQTARLTDVTTGVPIREFRGHDAGVWGSAISPDGQVVVTASGDGTLKLWDVPHDLPAFFAHDGGVHSVTWSKSGELITAGRDGWVRFWTTAGEPSRPGIDTDAFKVLLVRETHEGEILTVCDPDKVKLWDREGTPVRSWRQKGWIDVHRADVVHLAPVEGLCRLTTPREDEGVDLGRFDMNANSRAYFSADGMHVVINSEKPVIVNRAGIEQQRLLGERTYTAMRKNRLLAVAGKSAYICDAEGRDLHELRHDGAARNAKFSLDGKTVITLSRDKTARLWSTESGHLRLTLRHPGMVWDAVFSSDGKRVYTASFDGWVRCWYVDEDELLRWAKKRAGR